MELTPWAWMIIYVAAGFCLAWLIWTGIPSFIGWVWKNTKKVLGTLAGVLGAFCLIGCGCWMVVNLVL